MTSAADAALEYAREIAGVLAQGPGGLTLTSVIVHGSLGFGDFVDWHSDLDVLAVGDMDLDHTEDVATAIDAIPAIPVCRGLEMTIVSTTDIADFTPLRPFRLHVNLHDGGRRIVSGDGHEGDADLTLHYLVARTCGIAVWGAAAADVIPPQPRPLVARALASELDWALEDGEMSYAVLNAARALAYAREGLVLSKLEGWLWARRCGGPRALLDASLSDHLGTAVDRRWAAREREVRSFVSEVSSTLSTIANEK